ncbi:MAG: hypothetical protein AB7Q27_14190 [Acidimicrobiia bacterium]
MTASWTSEDVRAAVEPLAMMLGADGYALDAVVAGRAIRLAVAAGADACPTCLVPADLFASMVIERLRAADIDVQHSNLTIEYPSV